MLQINYIMLNEGVIIDIFKMHFEQPRHRSELVLNTEVDKVSNQLIFLRGERPCFYWNFKGFI